MLSSFRMTCSARVDFAFAQATWSALAGSLRGAGLAVLRASCEEGRPSRPKVRELPSAKVGKYRDRAGRMRGAPARRPRARARRDRDGPKGGRAAKNAPILVFLPSFDGYSSTFREPPSRPRSGNVLTCGNADRRPRSTRGFLKSIRITVKMLKLLVSMRQFVAFRVQIPLYKVP